MAKQKAKKSSKPAKASKAAVKAAAGASYKDLHAEALKPLSERTAVVPGRDGKLHQVRRYCMDPAKATEMRKALRTGKGEGGNPHRLTGIYGAVVQSLIDLGINKAHSFKAVRNRVMQIMKKTPKGETNAWDAFVNREARNADTGKDANGRLVQTLQVLQRITGRNPYGEKLRQLFACIDILAGKSEGEMLFRLNTTFRNYGSVKPTNECKRRGRKPKAAKPKAKAKKAPAKKATKPKAKAKPKVKAKSKKRPARKRPAKKSPEQQVPAAKVEAPAAPAAFEVPEAAVEVPEAAVTE